MRLLGAAPRRSKVQNRWEINDVSPCRVIAQNETLYQALASRHLYYSLLAAWL